MFNCQVRVLVGKSKHDSYLIHAKQRRLLWTDVCPLLWSYLGVLMPIGIPPSRDRWGFFMDGPLNHPNSIISFFSWGNHWVPKSKEKSTQANQANKKTNRQTNKQTNQPTNKQRNTYHQLLCPWIVAVTNTSNPDAQLRAFPKALELRIGLTDFVVEHRLRLVGECPVEGWMPYGCHS